MILVKITPKYQNWPRSSVSSSQQQMNQRLCNLYIFLKNAIGHFVRPLSRVHPLATLAQIQGSLN